MPLSPYTPHHFKPIPYIVNVFIIIQVETFSSFHSDFTPGRGLCSGWVVAVSKCRFLIFKCLCLFVIGFIRFLSRNETRVPVLWHWSPFALRHPTVQVISGSAPRVWETLCILKPFVRGLRAGPQADRALRPAALGLCARLHDRGDGRVSLRLRVSLLPPPPQPCFAS